MTCSGKQLTSDRLADIWYMLSCFQTGNLAQVSPSLLVSVGVLSMAPDDVGWRMMLAAWLERRPESEYDLLCSLCDQYVETIIQHVNEMTKPPVLATTQLRYVRVTPQQTNENMIATLMTLVEVRLSSSAANTVCMVTVFACM